MPRQQKGVLTAPEAKGARCRPDLLDLIVADLQLQVAMRHVSEGMAAAGQGAHAQRASPASSLGRTPYSNVFAALPHQRACTSRFRMGLLVVTIRRLFVNLYLIHSLQKKGSVTNNCWGAVKEPGAPATAERAAAAVCRRPSNVGHLPMATAALNSCQALLRLQPLPHRRPMEAIVRGRVMTNTPSSSESASSAGAPLRGQ